MNARVLAAVLALWGAPAVADDYATFAACVTGPSGSECADVVLGCANRYDWTDATSAPGRACFADERMVSEAYLAQARAEMSAADLAALEAFALELAQACGDFIAQVPASQRSAAEAMCEAATARRLAVRAVGIAVQGS